MSVGHVARLLEEAGIATVIVAVEAFRLRLESMSVPRLLVTPHPMGRPLGPPGDHARHREVLRAALGLLGREERSETAAYRLLPMIPNAFPAYTFRNTASGRSSP